jgi:Concanavalin A-like lectin/glucanases superfamily
MAPEENTIDQAIGRFLDGEAEPDDGPALAHAMAQDSRIAHEVRRLLTIDGLLHQTADVDSVAFSESIQTRLSAEDDGALFTQAVTNRIQTSVPLPAVRRGWLRWAVVSVACFTAASFAVIWLATQSTSRSPDLPVAVLVNEANALFAENAAPTGGHFSPGTFRLQAGTVHLRFASGAEVVMRSPAQFTIVDAMNMALIEGALRAVVPASAHGFSVLASDVRYEDLGTEFGVSVGKQPGESQLHVFEGRVDLKTRQGRLLSSVEVGESVRVSGGKVEKTELDQLENFPTAGTIGMEKWLRWSERAEKDPSLLCYYPFIPDAADGALLKDHAFNRPSLDGRISGARWVTGRWPGKQALLFDRDGDHVAVDVPGEFRHLTMAAWIYLDRSDFALNAVLNSDGWQPGALHCQFSRSGEFFFGHWANKPKRKQLGPRVPIGRWTHVAAVADLDRLETQTYINGELAEKVRLSSFPGPLTPGSCRIGDWLRHPEFTSIPNRGFRGRIDELALWQRSLTREEIREMVAAGRSSLGSVE